MESHLTRTHKLKNPLITGTLFLTAAGVLSRIIGFFYRIFLSRTIGAQGLGVYQLVFPIMALCFSFTSAGIQTAISRFVAEQCAKCNEKGARLYLSMGLLCSCALSVVVTFLISRNANWIATAILGEAQCADLLSAMTYCLIPASVHACINGYYYGKQKALIPSVSQLVEQIARVLGVYLIYCVATSEGHTLRPIDAIWGLVIGEFFGMLVSLTAVGMKRSAGKIEVAAKQLIFMAIPLTANRVLINLCASVENLLIPRQLRLFGYSQENALGIYGILTGMAISVILFPTVLTNSISVLLLPVISEAKAKKNEAAIHTAISKAIRYGLILGFAFTLAFLLTGNYIGNHIFCNALAGTYIRILSWICPFMYLSTLLNSILHGLGYPKTTLRINLAGCAIRILIVWFFVPVIGIRAYLAGMLVSQVFMALACIFSLGRLQRE